MVELPVPVVLEGGPHLHRAQRVDVQVARAAAEERRLQRPVAGVDEVLPLQEREDVLDLRPEVVHVTLVGEERAAEELEQLLLRSHVARGDRREGSDDSNAFGHPWSLRGASAPLTSRTGTLVFGSSNANSGSLCTGHAWHIVVKKPSSTPLSLMNFEFVIAAMT